MAQTDPISVLLVEDDPAARANIAEILVRAGMVVDLVALAAALVGAVILALELFVKTKG